MIRSPVRLTRSVPRGATRFERTGPIAGQNRGRRVPGTVVVESWRASVGKALGHGEREADGRHALGCLGRPRVGGRTATDRAEGHAFRGEGLVRRLLDDLVPQRVGGIEGVASGVCSERDANPS